MRRHSASLDVNGGCQRCHAPWVRPRGGRLESWGRIVKTSTHRRRNRLFGASFGCGAAKLGRGQVAARPMQENEGGRRVVGQIPRLVFAQSVGRQKAARLSARRSQGGGGPVNDRDGQRFGDFAPVLPAVEPGEIVRPHDPHEPRAGTAALQPADGVDGVARADLRLKAGDIDAGMIRQRAGGRHPRLQRRQAVVVLQGIAGRGQPPHAVKPEPRQGHEAGQPVALVRRIERAAKQADAQPGGAARQPDRRATPADPPSLAWLPTAYAHFMQNEG